MGNGVRAPVAWLALLCITNVSAAVAAPLPSHRSIDVRVSNDAGALYGDGPDTYFINAPGGGLNQLHITTDSSSSGLFGQVTTRNIASSSASGAFWITTTGGRGYNDGLVLLVSLQGPVADNFSLTVRSSGYQWTPSAAGVVNPIYNATALEETFTKADFLYGPQTTKPGPGSGPTLPFYSGQDISDPATAAYLMFIDLNVGNDSVRSSIDSGSAKVESDISGMYDTTVAFNAYAWAFSAMIANSSINWTNRLSTNPAEAGQSGYSITTTAVAAVPEPATILLLGAGLAGLAAVRRRYGSATMVHGGV